MRITKFLLCIFGVIFLFSACSEKETVAIQTDKLDRLEPAAGHLMMDYMPDTDMRGGMEKIKLNLPEAIVEPMWVRNAAAYKRNPVTRPKIVVVIDDLGLNHDRSARTAELPGPLTLSYLPYALDLPSQTAIAQSNGHELMVHMPMQPLRNTADPGPDALLTGMSKTQLLKRIRDNLNAFDGYVGINNHMGSAFTQDQKGLRVLMAELNSRDMLYLDSRTSPTSIAEQTARSYNVATTGRDVFLDHVITEDFIEAAFKRTEDHALKHGSAIAIGHPHELTIEKLSEWLPTLRAKGFDLVPITAVMTERDPRIQPVDYSAVSDY